MGRIKGKGQAGTVCNNDLNIFIEYQMVIPWTKKEGKWVKINWNKWIGFKIKYYSML